MSDYSFSVSWWSKYGDNERVVVFLWGRMGQVSEILSQPEEPDSFRDWQAATDAPNCLVCIVSGL